MLHDSTHRCTIVSVQDTPCEVCGGLRFVKAAQVSNYSHSHPIGRVALWEWAVVVPCFVCTPNPFVPQSDRV